MLSDVCGLLCNVCRLEANCTPTLNQAGPLIKRMSEVFASDASGSSSTHLPSLIMNLTQIEEAREFVRDHLKASLIPALAHHTRNHDTRVRRAAVGALRNYMMLMSEHEYMTSSEVDIVTVLCYPLIGKADIIDDEDKDGMTDVLIEAIGSKSREPDAMIRKLCVEGLYTLTTTKTSRFLLSQRKVYPIVRECDKDETDDETKELIYNLVSAIILGEEEDGLKNSSSNNNSDNANNDAVNSMQQLD
eukprot:c55_g1_i1.p1 GENE.c55_g1_i1~~c55_g1_i1.p1  ORF type:complete len:246 (-),score=78.97 c55_g1_i1:79-816(-)